MSRSAGGFACIMLCCYPVKPHAASCLFLVSHSRGPAQAPAPDPISIPAPDPISALTPDDLSRGKRLFESQCSVCHGATGEGGKGANLAVPKLKHAADSAGLFDVIKSGVEGTGMPGAWMYTDREIWQIAGYVRSLGRTEPVKLPGDSVHGKTLYERKGACSGCHIVSGRGRGFGPELTEVGIRRSAAYLRQCLRDPAKSHRREFLSVHVRTRDGRDIQGIRVNEDSFTIQIKDGNNRFHSFRKGELQTLDKQFETSMMPSYANQLTPVDIDDIVAYLASLRGEP